MDGRVQIAANKGDVTVQDDKGTTTVTQGQQTTRDDTSDTEKKKRKKRAAGAAVGGGWRNHEFDGGDRRRIGRRGRGCSVGLVTERRPGESGVPDESLPVIF